MSVWVVVWRQYGNRSLIWISCNTPSNHKNSIYVTGNCDKWSIFAINDTFLAGLLGGNLTQFSRNEIKSNFFFVCWWNVTITVRVMSQKVKFFYEFKWNERQKVHSCLSVQLCLTAKVYLLSPFFLCSAHLIMNRMMIENEKGDVKNYKWVKKIK